MNFYSSSFSCEVRNVFNKKTIIKIEDIVFVLVDEDGKPKPHGKNLTNLNLSKS